MAVLEVGTLEHETKLVFQPSMNSGANMFQGGQCFWTKDKWRDGASDW